MNTITAEDRIENVIAESRVEKRRCGRTYLVGISQYVEFPQDWITHQLVKIQIKTVTNWGRRLNQPRWPQIVEAIDNNTSGEWGWSASEGIIAFENEADLTMFLLVFKG